MAILEGVYTQPDGRSIAIPIKVNADGSLFVGETDTMPQTQILPFASTIKFDRAKTFYLNHLIVEPIAFTIDSSSPIVGAESYVRLIANGAITPSFTGFKQLNGSSGWDGRNGILNLIQFFYDGSDYWCAIAQQVNAAPIDSLAPALLSATIPAESPSTIVLKYSETLLSSSVPAATAFTIGGVSKTINTISITGDSIELVFNTAFVASDAVTVSYSATGSNNIKDIAGNNALNLSGQGVANNIALGRSLTFSTRSAAVAVTGERFTNSSNVQWGSSMASDRKLAANTDGWFSVLIEAGMAILGMNAQDENVAFNAGTGGYEYLMYNNVTESQWYRGTNGGGVATTSNNAFLASSTKRARLRRASGVIFAEISNDGSAWITVYTWPGVNNADLFFNVNFSNAETVINAPRSFGAVAK
jgi:Putative flagellar system-associated repeat